MSPSPVPAGSSSWWLIRSCSRNPDTHGSARLPKLSRPLARPEVRSTRTGIDPRDQCGDFSRAGGARYSRCEGRVRVSVPKIPGLTRYVYDAITELKAARVGPFDLRGAGAALLGDVFEKYDEGLRESGLVDPQDHRLLAAARVIERAVPWLQKFSRVVFHALYDLTEAEFHFVRSLIEALPDGGVVVLFNTTANVKPTQFAEWTWQRFVRDESLADKTFPEFCRSSGKSRHVLERLFNFQTGEPLPLDDSLRIVEAAGRYKEIERISGDISDLLVSGASPNEIAVVVRHIESYGERLEDVLSRDGIPHSFETGIPLLRIPFIKYWLALLDLVTS